jgi:hypothetical protein
VRSAGLVVSVLLQHELDGITATLAGHEVRIERLERAARPAAFGPWQLPPARLVPPSCVCRPDKPGSAAHERRRLQRGVNSFAGDRRSWAPTPKLRTKPTIPRAKLVLLQERFRRPPVREQHRQNAALIKYLSP